MRAVLIINPVSGDNEPNTEKISRIQELLRDAPFTMEVLCTSTDDTASSIARRAVEDGFEVILVGGGDGTVGDVARQVIHKNATLGVIPIGTFNNVARSLGIPADLTSACRIIRDGFTRMIDVGEAGGHWFLEAAGAGLDAVLFPLGEEIKGGRWTRILQIARLMLQYHPQKFKLTFDRPLAEVLPPARQRHRSRRSLAGHVLRRHALFVVAANGPYYGGGFTVAPGARLNDGCLTISVFRNFSKWELLSHFQSISRGRHRYSPKLETYTSKQLHIDCAVSMPVHVDGQPIGRTPVAMRAVSAALRVFAPENPIEPGQGQ